MVVAEQPIAARMRGVNRAEICDVNFSEFVRDWSGRVDAKPSPHEAILDGSALAAQGFAELLESQLISRHLDLMARVLRVQNKVFYTIGSSGHEGNAMVARANVLLVTGTERPPFDTACRAIERATSKTMLAPRKGQRRFLDVYRGRQPLGLVAFRRGACRGRATACHDALG